MKTYNTIILILFVVLFTSFSQEDSISRPLNRYVYVIPVSGPVEPGMASFIGRAIELYESDKEVLFVLELNTFGGRVDAALAIVDTMSSIPANNTIAYVKTKAISAGSLIALSCGNLYMKHNTTIGDCAPIMVSNDGPKMLGEKHQSPLRAKFRALAKRNNYPVTLSESMVSQNITVMKVEFADTILYVDSLGLADMSKSQKSKIISKKTIVKNGELLTMDDQEAVALGFSRMSVSGIEDLLTKSGIENYTVIRIEENWSEQFVRFIAKIAPILMMLGFAAIYTEVKSPGFGVPGIVGIICLALVFGGQYIVGMADYTELLLLMIGIIFLAAEVFVIPGFGVAGFLGIFFLAAGMALSFQDFVIPKPEIPWQKNIFIGNIRMVLLSLMGSVVTIVLFFKYAFPKFSQIVPGPQLREDLTNSTITAGQQLNVNTGDCGIVVKPLRPSGSIEIDDQAYDVISDGEFIDKGKQVKIIQISGNTIKVIEA